MYYYKQVKNGEIVSVEAKSIDVASPGFVKATEGEYNDYISSLPEVKPEPPQYLGRELFLSVSEGYIEAGTATKRGMFPTAQGAANLVEPKVYWSIKVPIDFVSFTSVKAVWLVESGHPTNMYWRLDAHYGALGESPQVHTDLPGWGVTATVGNGLIAVQEAALPLTLANLALDDYLGIYFGRFGSDALDTLDTTVELFGLLFTYVTNQ